MTQFESPFPNFWEREMDILRMLQKMESRGVLLDQEMCRRERAIGEAELFRLHEKLGNYSPTSSRQLEKLFRKIGIPLLEDHKTKNGSYSFDKAAMEDYDRLLELRADQYGETAKDILAYRGWNKTITSNYNPYLELVSPDGRLRPNFNQSGTKTGRFSCNEPNLQQIPRNSPKRWNGKLKEVFIAKPGFRLVGVDYSQLEFRLGAAYAQQTNLIDIFNRSKYPEKYSKEERDVFTQMANELNKDRQDCKTLTYAKTFGAGLMKIAIMLGDDIPELVRHNYRKPDKGSSIERYSQYKAAWEYLKSLESAKFYSDWEKNYSRIVAHAKYVNEYAQEQQFIRMWSSRRRRFPGGRDAHKAYNSLIQGGGAEIVKSAMLRLYKEIDNPECEMLLQVHDSVLFEIKENKVDYYLPMICELMSAVEREKDFGVFFSVEPEFWGRKD